MKPETGKQPASGAERGRRFRERQRAIAMPTDAQLDRTIRQIVVDNIASVDMTPAKVMTAARDRLLKQGFSCNGEDHRDSPLLDDGRVHTRPATAVAVHLGRHGV